MAENTIEEPIVEGEKGAGFLFWGLIFVAVLNLAMVIGALAIFGP